MKVCSFLNLMGFSHFPLQMPRHHNIQLQGTTPVYLTQMAHQTQSKPQLQCTPPLQPQHAEHKLQTPKTVKIKRSQSHRWDLFIGPRCNDFNLVLVAPSFDFLQRQHPHHFENFVEFSLKKGRVKKTLPRSRAEPPINSGWRVVPVKKPERPHPPPNRTYFTSIKEQLWTPPFPSHPQTHLSFFFLAFSSSSLHSVKLFCSYFLPLPAR